MDGVIFCLICKHGFLIKLADGYDVGSLPHSEMSLSQELFHPKGYVTLLKVYRHRSRMDSVGPQVNKINKLVSVLGDASLWTRICFFLKFLEDISPFVGPPIPLFWTSGDIYPGSKSQGGFLSRACFVTNVQQSHHIHLWNDTC